MIKIQLDPLEIDTIYGAIISFGSYHNPYVNIYLTIWKIAPFPLLMSINIVLNISNLFYFVVYKRKLHCHSFWFHQSPVLKDCRHFRPADNHKAYYLNNFVNFI